MKQFLKKGKAEGSVLFTVVSVMLVLVVFLMSTMVLTSSANRRSYYTYFETQAQYAAQAALDAVTNSAYTDAGFYEWVKAETASKIGRPLSEQPKVTVNFGTGLNPAIANDDSGIQFTGNNSSVECTIEQTGKKIMVWDDVTQAVHEQTAYKITATASVGNGRNRADYTVVNYIYENFRVPEGSEIPSVMNNASNTIKNWNRSGAPGDPGSGGSILQAVWSLGMADTANNMTYFGPQYSGMASIPVGRIKYDKAGQNLNKSNDNYAVGNAVYVGNYNLVNSYMMNFTFEKFGESAQFWGNLQYDGAAKAAGGDGKDQGFFFNAKISEDEVTAAKAAYGSPIPYTAQPYVYVDGVVRLTKEGGLYFGRMEKPANDKGGRSGDFYNVNLFCGGVQMANANTGAEFSVGGDLYMYDPLIESEIKGVDGYTVLARFTSDNINKANTQWSDYAVGGNVICNNQTLRLNTDNNRKNLVIDGDLILTNPAGALYIFNDITVRGKVLCAAYLSEESLNRINCNTIVSRTYAKVNGNVLSVDNYTENESYYVKQNEDGQWYFDYDDFLFTRYGDGAYDDRVKIDMDAYRATGYVLMPYSMRLDEIFDEYLRWDLQSDDITIAAENAHNDPYVQESKNCGHIWGSSDTNYSMKTFESESIYVWDTFEEEEVEVIWWDVDDYTFYHSGLDTVSYEKGEFFDETGQRRWSKGVYRTIQNVGKEGHWTSGYAYVPYTTHVTNNNFIEHFEPVTSESAIKAKIDPKYYIDTLAEFEVDMDTAPRYNSKNEGLHKDVSVVYHKNDQNYGSESAALGVKTLKNAMIITDSCYINMNELGDVPVFIDPYAKSFSDSKPMRIVMSGSNSRGNVIINNTAIYSGADYTTYSSLASTGSYASRRQVYIFFADDFEANASPGFRIYMSGTYGQSGAPDVFGPNSTEFKAGDFRVVSNPIYPDSTTWDSLDYTVKYAYELVPNTVIFGQRNANYKFNNAGFLNAEILMPTSYMDHSNASNYKAKIDYKEEYYSLSYNTAQTAQGDAGLPCIGLGTILCKGITTGSNTACMVYIGDTHRGGGEPSIVYDPDGGNNPNSAKLGSDNQDFFNNDHMGAS